MRRLVVISVLCMWGMGMAWHYDLTLAVLAAYHAWLGLGVLLVGIGLTSMWSCPRNLPTTDVAWYLALFPSMGGFAAGVGWQCDDGADAHGDAL